MTKLRNKISLLLIKIAAKLSVVEHKAGIKTDGCFRTAKGIKFNILHPTPEMIDITDIAKGLAYKPHFSGFSPKFFSIAEHSLLVERIIANDEPFNYKRRMEALLHDASEAYTGDMIKPLKNLLPNFVIIEKLIQNAIYKRYGIIPSGVKAADNVAQDIEASNFYGKANHEEIRYLSPDSAYADFLNKYEYLKWKLM